MVGRFFANDENIDYTDTNECRERLVLLGSETARPQGCAPGEVCRSLQGAPCKYIVSTLFHAQADPLHRLDEDLSLHDIEDS